MVSWELDRSMQQSPGGHTRLGSLTCVVVVFSLSSTSPCAIIVTHPHLGLGHVAISLDCVSIAWPHRCLHASCHRHCCRSISFHVTSPALICISIYLLSRCIVIDLSNWIRMGGSSCWRWGHKPRKWKLLKIRSKLNLNREKSWTKKH